MRRGRSKRFVRVGHRLPAVLRRLGLSETLAAQRAVLLWPEIAGKRVAAHSRAIDVEGKILVVEVDSPAWLTELAFLKGTVLKAICRRIGGGLVTDVKFRLK